MKKLRDIKSIGISEKYPRLITSDRSIGGIFLMTGDLERGARSRVVWAILLASGTMI